MHQISPLVIAELARPFAALQTDLDQSTGCFVTRHQNQSRHDIPFPTILTHSFTVMQAKNEELVTKAAKVSEEDMAAVQAECERRLGAAERKAYALAKERDALRRGSDKLSSANDLLKEKDNIIAQVSLQQPFSDALYCVKSKCNG